ncbi:hypothetical protein ACIBI7_35795 [Nonomuraea fuscirosea]|uniref:hypothetical protein n=1 Tax=Nonomuraea fuscirosea TaxID=1291556 RepID=UPI0037AA0A8C
MNPTTVAHLQLSSLRKNNPAYEFVRGKDEFGRECWKASLCVEITDAMKEAGLRQDVQGSDYASLLLALSPQIGILYRFRGSRLAPRPRVYAI